MPTSSTTENYTFYPRQAWGALPPEDLRPLSTPTPYVVIHHTYIPAACDTRQECSKDMRGMQRYHMSQGWGDIGFNFCVGGDGAAYEGRGWDVVGVHAGLANNFSIGICIIGDWRVELPPEAALETTKELIADGVSKGAIAPDYKVIGHNQAMATECPGKALLHYIATWKHYQPGPVHFPPKQGRRRNRN